MVDMTAEDLSRRSKEKMTRQMKAERDQDIRDIEDAAYERAAAEIKMMIRHVRLTDYEPPEPESYVDEALQAAEKRILALKHKDG